MRKLRFVLAVALAVAAPSMTEAQNPAAGPRLEGVTFAPSLGVDLPHSRQVRPGLFIRDLHRGTGPTVASGREVTVWIWAWRPDGTALPTGDSDTIHFRQGGGAMLQAFEQALAGMRPGGRRQVILASDLAYGTEGGPSLPPNTPLVLDLTFLAAE